MNKFKQVSSDDRQMSVTEGGRSHVWYQEGEVPMSQCIMGNGHMGPPSSEQNDKHL